MSKKYSDIMEPDLRIPLIDKSTNGGMIKNGALHSARTEPGGAPKNTNKAGRKYFSGNTAPNVIVPPPSFSDIILFILIAGASSMQFGIFLMISDKATPFFSQYSMLNNQTIKDFTVLCWRWQIYFFLFFIFGLIAHIINKIRMIYSPNTSVLSRFELNEYGFCASLKYFLSTSDLDNILQTFSYDNITSSFLSVISTFCLFYSSRILTFSSVALINGIPSIIPLYFISYNNDPAFSVLKLLCPYILLSGMVVSNNTSLMNLFVMGLCLLSVLGFQFVNQVTLSSKFKTCSPFEVLLCSYFSYFIISTFIVIGINLAFGNYNFVFATFGWFLFLDVDLLMWSLIGFGIGGALYAMLSVFGSISLAKKDILKDIKYLDILLNDVMGCFVFKRYSYTIFTTYYLVGLFQSIISLLMLDFSSFLSNLSNKSKTRSMIRGRS